MTYAVFGYRSGQLDLIALRIAVKSNEQRWKLTSPVRERMMRGYSVTDERAPLLRGQFGSDYQNFAVLDDVAIEACQNFGISIGEYLGSIDNAEINKLAHIPYFAYAYFMGA